MLSEFQQHLHNHFPFLLHSKLLVAVSGGIDSMVLVDLLKASGYDIALAHCNFQLRGEDSYEDENFVREYAQGNQLPVYIKRFDTLAVVAQEKFSVQMVARDLRYEWFSSLLQSENRDYVLTAHHLDDAIETFLINFTRGTGIDGLAGIPEFSGKIVRPLLAFTRRNIETYAAENLIAWREDSSNSEDKYLRNALRHRVVPILKELNPSFTDSFQQTLTHLKQTQLTAQEGVSRLLAGALIKDKAATRFAIQAIPSKPLRNACLYAWLKDYGFSAWEDIYNLPEAQSGKQVLAPGHILLKDREHLILEAVTELDTTVYTIASFQAEVNIPLKLRFSNVSNISNPKPNCIFVDADVLQFPLKIRRYQEGDYFYPFGMKGKKKVSKYLKDEKIPVTEKQKLWVLCSEGQIVWLIGMRMDDRFKTKKQTTKILQIQLHE